MLAQQMVLEQVGIHRKKKNIFPILHTHQKIHFEWCIDLNVRAKTIKLLGKNRRESFDLRVYFLR